MADPSVLGYKLCIPITGPMIRKALEPLELAVVHLVADYGRDVAVLRELMQGRSRVPGKQGHVLVVRGAPSEEAIAEALASAEAKIANLVASEREDTRQKRRKRRILAPTQEEEKQVTQESEVRGFPNSTSPREAGPADEQGFAARIRSMTEQEAADVAHELRRVRFRADQVVEVARSIGMAVPPELEQTGWYGGEHVIDGPVALPPLESPAAVEEPEAVEEPTVVEEPTEEEQTTEQPVLDTWPEPLQKEPERVAKASVSEHVLNYLASHPGSGLGKIQRDLDFAQSSISRVLAELMASGRVRKEKAEDGAFAPAFYFLADQPSTSTTLTPPERKEERPTEIPEELREMPAASLGGPLPQRIETATIQKRIVDALAEEPSSAAELGEKLGVRMARVADNIRELAKVGLASLTDEQRGGPVWQRGIGTPQSYELTGDLADMPIAAGETPPAMKLVVARQQLRVLRVAESVGKPFVVPELDDRFPWPRTRTKNYMDAFVEQGRFIRRTGRMRRAKGQDGGRTAVEFVATSVQQDQFARKPETETVEGPGAQRVIEDVRTAMRAREGEDFGVNDIMDDTGLPRSIVHPALERFADASVLERLAGPGTVGRYLYERPREAGAAAKLDAERRKSAASSERSVSEPVQGTGRPFKSASSEVNALINDIRKAGGRAEPTDGGHIAVIWTRHDPLTGRDKEVRKTIRSTPSGNAQREVMHDRARLRREGLGV